MHAFITSRIDYCYSLLYGLPAKQLDKIRRVQNTAARIIFRLPKFCRITPSLFSLHWLPVRYRITKNTLGDRSFAVAAPGIRNSLPSKNDIEVFKRHLKVHFFTKAFSTP